jgi:hypothetical protein
MEDDIATSPEAATPAYGKAAATEIAAIEQRMKSDRTGYFKDETMQARYRELISVREEPTAAGEVQGRPWQEIRDEPRSLPGDEPADEPLTLPAHDYRLPEDLRQDELAQSFASFAGIAGLPEHEVADIVSSQYHGGQLARDGDDRMEAMDELRQVWGDKTAANIQKVRQYVKRNMPPNLAEALEFPARRSDGRALMNDAALIVKLHGLASMGAELPDTGGDVNAQISAIKNVMKTNMAAYRKDGATQMRLTWLLREQARRGRR